jgi:transcription antitermination factor NusG
LGAITAKHRTRLTSRPYWPQYAKLFKTEVYICEMTAGNWFVAATLPRAELQSRRNLEQQKFTCFLPRFRKTRRHARRVDHLLAPLFPGYIFVHFDRNLDPWHSINGTYGVRRLVGSSLGMPQPMPDAAMQALLARCDGDIIFSQIPTLKAGQHVRVSAGPFVEQLATVERLDDKGRVHVLLHLLGAFQSVRVSASDLGPI